MKHTLLSVLSVISLAQPALGAPLARLTGAQLKEKLSGAPVTVVNFWATWCEPCKEEFPALLKSRQKFDKEGARFVFVSMDYDSQEKNIQSFLDSQKIGFETYWRTGNEMEFINGVLPDWSGAIPTTAFFDRDGKLIKMIQAKVTQKSLAGPIQAALKTAAKAEPEKSEKKETKQ